MNSRSKIKSIIIMLGVMISLSVVSVAQETSTLDDDDKALVLSIYEKLKVDYDSQLNHINVRADASDGVVVLEGWVASKSDLKKITKLIKKIEGINCVVVAKLKVGKGVGCGPGQQECGGTCISNKDTCTICLMPGKCNP